MNEHTQLLRPGDAEWDEWVRKAPHDFYHLAAYHAFAEKMGEGTAFLVVHGTPRQFLAWPYLLRDIDGSHADGNSVYGYSGPVGEGLEDREFLARAWQAFGALWATQRMVTLFTRFHPILENHRCCETLHGIRASVGGELQSLGRTVSIDLLPEREGRRRTYRKNLRQEIQASERAGLHVELDECWHEYGTFIDFYRRTMQRNKAAGRYRFSNAYFDALRTALGEQANLAVALVNDEPAAILLFTLCNNLAQAHLTGVNPNFARLSPLKGLIDGTAELARVGGARLLHLGGGRGAQEDSLFRFKSHFSPLHHEFRLGRWILDGPVNDSLSKVQHGETAPEERDYFPTYRAPRT